MPHINVDLTKPVRPMHNHLTTKSIGLIFRNENQPVCFGSRRTSGSV